MSKQETIFDDWVSERLQFEDEDKIGIWTAFQAGWEAALANIREEVYAKFRVTPETLEANRKQVDRARKPLHCEDIAYGLAKVNTAALSHVMGVTDGEEREPGTEGKGCVPGAAEPPTGDRPSGEASVVVSGEGSSAVLGGHAAEGASDAGVRHDRIRGTGVRRFRVKDWNGTDMGIRFIETENEKFREILGDGTVNDIGDVLDEHDIAVSLAEGWWKEVPVEEPADCT